jgi:hypothetical protein
MELLRCEHKCSAFEFFSKLTVQLHGERGFAKATKPNNRKESLQALLSNPWLELLLGVLQLHRLSCANELGRRCYDVSGSDCSGRAAIVVLQFLHPVPHSPLADMLRPSLEVADLGGDAVASLQRGHQVPLLAEVHQYPASTGLAAEAVIDVVGAVLDVVGHLTHLLHPVQALLVVVALRPLQPVEEGLHAGQLVGDVLDVIAGAPDQGVLLREEAPKLVHQGFHGVVRGADDEVHRRPALSPSPVETRYM